MDRNLRARVIYRAEALERCTKRPGRRSGALGLTGLAVLRCLLFRFGARPEPSYDAIQRGTGLCLQTISDALTRLAARGIIAIERRRNWRGDRKISNAYTFPPAQLGLPLPSGEHREPIEKLPSFVPWNEWSGPLKDALERLGATISPQQNQSEAWRPAG